MRVSFSVSQWAAWAPGLTTPEAWRAWAAATPVCPQGRETPPLTEVPAMARRRVERLGRPAYQVAQWCAGEQKGLPLVFASRHGDAGRGSDLLHALARREPLSPTSFALSVHNAVGAQFSIIRGETSNVTAIANGIFTTEAGVLEAVMLLADAPEVLLVVYDAGPPDFYKAFWSEPEADFAWAWRLKRGSELTLETIESQPTPMEPLPHCLSVLRFFLGGEKALVRADAVSGWRWTRDG